MAFLMLLLIVIMVAKLQRIYENTKWYAGFNNYMVG